MLSCGKRHSLGPVWSSKPQLPKHHSALDLGVLALPHEPPKTAQTRLSHLGIIRATPLRAPACRCCPVPRRTVVRGSRWELTQDRGVAKLVITSCSRESRPRFPLRVGHNRKPTPRIEQVRRAGVTSDKGRLPHGDLLTRANHPLTLPS
jgi:hypothetical protein